MKKTNKVNDLIREAKNSVGLGMTSMAGLGALGAMSAIPGMPAQSSQVINSSSVGLNLLNVGQLAKSGMVVAKLGQKETEYKNATKKIVNKSSERIRKIIG